MKRQAVLTSAALAWGSLRSICMALAAHPRFELILLVGGMHLADGFGHTSLLIEEDGFTLAERLPWIEADATPVAQGAAAMTRSPRKLPTQLRPTP